MNIQSLHSTDQPPLTALIRLLMFVLSLLLAMNVAGQNNNDTARVDLTELSLDELNNIKIVSASKTEQAASQAPATVIVITEDQIRMRGYRSLLDVMTDAPDFKIDDKVYSSSRNIITMRGIHGQEKFLILLDGVRISSPTNEALPVMENYPVNMAKQIEIIYGPASALYGADAFTGIINIISKKAEFTKSKSEFSYSMGTQGLYNGSLFTSRKLGKAAFLTLSGQYFYDKGFDMSKVFKHDTLWDMTSHRTGNFNTIYGPVTATVPVKKKFEAPLLAYNIFARLRADDFELSFFTNYVQNSSALENNPSNAVYNRDVFYGRGILAISAVHRETFGKVMLSSTLAFSQYKVNPESNYRNLYSGITPAYKYAYSSMLMIDEQLEWKRDKNTNLVGGIVFQRFFSVPESPDIEEPVKGNNASPKGTLINTRGEYRPNGLSATFYKMKYLNAGVYVQLQQRMLNEKATLTAGARYDHNSRFGARFNPRVGFVWNVHKHTTFKIMVATSYFAPQPGSIYSYWGSLYSMDGGQTYKADFLHLPNPKLKPIISKNAEMSISQYLNRNFAVTLTGYYIDVDNLIDAMPDEGNSNIYNGKYMGWNVDYIEVFTNRGEQHVGGASIQLLYNNNFHRGSLKAYGYLSYVGGSQSMHIIDENGVDHRFNVELDNISHLMLKAGIETTFHRFSFSPRLVWLSDQHIAGFKDVNNPYRRQTIDGYALLNVSLSYRIRMITFFGNLTNALNQKYRAVGPGMDLNVTNTPLFYGNHQDLMRFNGGVRVIL